MKSYSYYLFDADGTLIDTAEMIFQCFLKTCRTFGNFEVAREEVISHIGLTLRSQLEHYLGALDEKRFNEIAGAHMEYQLSIYPRYLRLFPGVKEALALLTGQGKRCAVVTSRRINTLGLFLKETGIYDFFKVFVTPENTKRHKPEPEPVLEALSLLGVRDKRDAIMVGDSSFDIECGSRAGVDTAFVKFDHNASVRPAVTPTWVIEGFMQLCPAD
jgi:pyrophosphatase PpaX